MSKTILITGASSGIGKETAKLFASRGWQVVATMRTPQDEVDLVGNDNILVTRLDVTDSDSIEDAVELLNNRKAQDDKTFIDGMKDQFGPDL